MKRKIGREARLAYLCHLLYQRLCTGKATRTDWERRFRLVVAMEQEKTFRELSELSKGAA